VVTVIALGGKLAAIEVIQIRAAIITNSHPFLNTDKLRSDNGLVRKVKRDSRVITLKKERRTNRQRYWVKIAPSTALMQMAKTLDMMVEAAVT
jgi:hypothetical protein